MNVVVIGAGFGGLSAAALLARDGFDVEVIDQLDQPGGRATQWVSEGFVFDLGPSWYLAPDIFERFFAEFDKEPSDYYTLKRLDPSYEVIFDDSRITIVSDFERNVELFESIEQGAGDALRRYVADARFKYDTAMERFLYKEYRSVFDFFTAELVSKGLKLNLFRSMKNHAARFFTDPRLRRIVTYPVAFLGSSEKKTPAIYSLLSHADFGLGVWYPDGGFHEVARGFERLAKEQGARFSYDEKVVRIESDGVRARRVVTSKRSIPADLVLVNADYATSELELLAPSDRSISARSWKRKSIAPSALVICIGVDKRIDIEHHTLFFDGDWEAHFSTVFDHPGWPTHPSFYVCTPSKSDPSVAPKGGENLFFLVPLAPGLADSDEERTRLRNHVIDRFEQRFGRIEDRIVTERIYSHRDFIERYGAYEGTAFGLAHTLFQSAAFRPSHRSKKLPNLFYTGHYTHPGVGVPMTIISSQIVARMMKRDAE